MADSDKTLKIEIALETTGQDQAAAAQAALKAVADESQRYQDKLQQMAEGDSTKAQDQRWADLTSKAKAHAEAVKAAAENQKKWEDALKQFDKGAQESGEATGEMTEHGRAQYMLMSEMNKVVPELGHLFHAAFSGPIGPLIIVTGLLAEAYGALRDFDKELDAAAKAGATADYLGNLTDQLQVLASAAADAQNFADRLNDIATANNNINTALQTQLSLMQAVERAQAAQTSAQKALDIARVQADEAAHKITPEQAAEKRAEIEKRSLKQEQTDRDAAQDAEVKKKQEALTAAQQLQGAMEAEAQAAADKVTAGKKHAADVKFTDADKAQLDKTIAQLGHLDELKQKNESGFATAGEVGEYWGAESRGDRGILEARAAGLRRRQQQDREAQSPAGRAREKAAEDDAAKAKEQAEANAKLITDLTAQIAALQATIAATRPIETQATAARQQTVEAQEAARISKEFETDFRTLDEFARNKHPSQAALERVQAAIADIVGIIKTQNDVVKTMPDYQAALADLKREVETVKSIQAAGGVNFSK